MSSLAISVLREPDTVPTVVMRRGTRSIALNDPVTVTVFGHAPVSVSYGTIVESGAELRCDAEVALSDGTVLVVTDRLRPAGSDAVRLARQARVVAVGFGEGLQVRLQALAHSPGSSEANWQYFLPCTLYNRNDSDGDGREDYLGTYAQCLRDDKNGSLVALARDSTSGAFFSIARVSLPTFDTAVTAEQLIARDFVQSTDIGSLGFSPVDEESVLLQASYPFAEESSFSLDTKGTGWQAFTPMASGLVAEITYEFRIDFADDFTEAVWGAFERQRQVLGTSRPAPGVSLDESVEYRQLLTLLQYRRWAQEENPKEPAGYLVHFSPRSGEVQGSLIEFGFAGDQTLVAWAQLNYGYRKGVPLYRNRARSVIDFFVDHCQLDNGFTHGIYDPINDRFTYWFTGILMPFQYAADEDDVRRYLGRQMADALMPIARELRSVKGNYLRTMCESFYPLLLAYELDASRGRVNDSWITAAERFGDFLLRVQAEDGSWYRAYDVNGDGLVSPPSWFGASYMEQKSGTIFPIPVLTTLHRLTGHGKYLDAAEKAADFLIAQYVDHTCYVGGLNDTTHIKSVKTDAVGIMFLMRSLLKVYEASGNRRHLEAAVKTAKILSTWVYLWDVPMPEGSLLGRAGFKSTGWAGCDVIASGSYLDDEFLEFTADLVRVAELARNSSLFDVAEIVEHGMQYAMSTPENDHGYVAPGIQCEGILTSYWLSAPDSTAFSGAVNKMKGDDNDTCNGLINAQAAYGIYSLVDAYGTSDFDLIREQVFTDPALAGVVGT